ncbi:thioredoxin domain-containing protein 9-like [Littorina saxatilis]|uniref:Thioredoxin domain-containing protein 9 n=1 Tax=Littorina saxatilis TaxID=31220 RepID=A0AAN9B181_9CAEN
MASNQLQNQLLAATQMIEQQVDAEIAKLENMEEDDFDALRRRRMEGLKKQQQQKQEWLNNGHGEYSEFTTEKEFFDQCKKSKKLVCHFYRDTTFRSKIVDKHLAILSPKHLETKFIRMNVEKCPFLVERLRIKVIPTICIAKDGKTTDYIVGFDDLGGRDDFPTEMMEWRLGRAEIIEYSGDLLTPPWDPANAGGYKSILGHPKRTNKTIKDDGDDDSDADGDW